MSEYERNQMTPDDVAKAIASGAYERKNGDTSATPTPKNERTPDQDKRSGLVIPYHYVGQLA